MDETQHIHSSLDELKQIEQDARRSRSLPELRRYFERVQQIRRLYPDDFDLQLYIAGIQQTILERGQRATSQTSDAFEQRETPARPPLDQPPAPAPPRAGPPIERLDAKSWKRSIYIGLFFTAIICAAFFYLIQTARRLNFTQPAASPQTNQNANDALGKTVPTQKTAAPAPDKPTVRLYTDLVPGTVAIDGKEPQDLKDGELIFDNLEPGQHSMKVAGRSGEANFSYEVAGKAAPKIVGTPTATNVMTVLVSAQGDNARLVTNADQAEVLLDGNSKGMASRDGLEMGGLGKEDHNLEIARNNDRQRFVLTYTPAPALTVYVKSDPNAGAIVVLTDQDGVDVYINDKLYRRKTERGQIRLPNLKVGAYEIRVHKDSFADPPTQTVEVKKGDESKASFQMVAIPQVATLQVTGALAGTSVFVNGEITAAVNAGGSATILNIKPGQNSIELRRDGALAKKFGRNFHTGEIITLSGPDVVLEGAVAEAKSTPLVVPQPQAPDDAAQTAPKPNGMQIDGQQVRRGGGFVPYHVPHVVGRYDFAAELRKSGFLKHGKIQWYAGFKDSDNYVLFSVDGKHANVRVVKDGHGKDAGRVSFGVDTNEWLQVEMFVKPDGIDARVKSAESEWTDLGSVPAWGYDLTTGKVGFYIPGTDEISISNFRFIGH